MAVPGPPPIFQFLLRRRGKKKAKSISEAHLSPFFPFFGVTKTRVFPSFPLWPTSVPSVSKGKHIGSKCCLRRLREQKRGRKEKEWKIPQRKTTLEPSIHFKSGKKLKLFGLNLGHFKIINKFVCYDVSEFP